MEVRWMPPGDLVPYIGNAKKHPQEQIDRLANGIKAFGWTQPIVIDKDNVVVIGHGRLLAAKQLHLDKVPVILRDDFDKDRANACRLEDNKSNESPWDFSKLEEELAALELAGFDMEQFGFDTEELEDQHEQNKQDELYADANILQLEKAQYPGVGEYDIPEIFTEDIPEITEWIGFNYMLTEEHPENKGVHCFVNDYQFERLWNNPDRYIEKLSRFAAVASPDFSPYADMPFCLQLFNHYRKHWVGRYLQENGVHVIPTIRASTDERSKNFYLDGEPVGGSVIISSMYTNTDEEQRIYREEFQTMVEKLKPGRIYVYGKLFGWEQGNITRVGTFTEKRFGR